MQRIFVVAQRDNFFSKVKRSAELVSILDITDSRRFEYISLLAHSKEVIHEVATLCEVRDVMTSYVLLRRLIVNNERGPLICTLAIYLFAHKPYHFQ